MRDCKRGHLASSCQVCELEDEIEELRADLVWAAWNVMVEEYEVLFPRPGKRIRVVFAQGSETDVLDNTDLLRAIREARTK